MDLHRFMPFHFERSNQVPVLLWNHRWEYDKNPDLFFESLFQLAEEGVEFQLIVLGESFKKSPSIFHQAKQKLSDRILHFGYADDFETYARLLWQADILPVTSHQDFFGGSVVEAVFCHTFSIFPKRLAYPEHLRDDEHQEYFYESDADFLPALRELLTTKRVYWQGFDEGMEFMEIYDWTQQAPIYDQRLADFLT